ncbi:hsp70 family chaperone [Metarhizium guizhouense ARSEF 977]|uniref:Hsp70 family chaperone n=1 Tax=Metarhizium guizhouense (strain ARSEF 977) TaxID=1276136 RepID=A0A0B4H3S7_METGA|nr:hsp70 family chaperone [Metarhizium guizhouense ARSEF 977]
MALKGSADLADRGAFMRKTSSVPNERWSMRGLMKRIKARTNSSFDDTLVIGIDFGTTQGNEINVITSWPGPGREEGKAPTELLYEHDKVLWGYEVPYNTDPIRWFKLLLLKDEDVEEALRLSDYYLRAKKMLRELNKAPTDFIADYLRALWQHTLDTIHKSRSKSVIAALTFHVVITVPAIWKDYARASMREAAAKAGILDNRPAGPTTLSFVPEPEAAALVTLCEYGKMLKTDDVYVICDAGGGTVDLISYRIGDLDPIELHEAVIGTGRSITHRKTLIRRYWNTYKPTYTSKDINREFLINILAEAFKSSDISDMTRKPYIKDGRIHFSNSDIQGAFTSAFSSIEKLVDGQIKEAKEKGLYVRGVILVGGLGASPYLYNHLKARYSKQDIEVLQAAGMRPRTAICRGAIFKGYLDGANVAGENSAPVSIVSTIARQSLGVMYNDVFEDGVHQKRDKYWDENEGIWRARNQMRWYLRKGDSVSTGEPIRHDFYIAFATEEEFDDDGGTLFGEILQCDDSILPSRRSKKVQKLCEIICKYDNETTFDLLEDYRGQNGNELKKFVYEVIMVPSGACTEFAVYYQGSKLGSCNVQIDFSK